MSPSHITILSPTPVSLYLDLLWQFPIVVLYPFRPLPLRLNPPHQEKEIDRPRSCRRSFLAITGV